jgi:transposase
MIPVGVQVFVALEPVDLRFGFERLSGWGRERSATTRARARWSFSSANVAPP